MRILAVGDLIGNAGIQKLKKEIGKLRETEKIDFVIVNGENSAEGMGITQKNFDDILSCNVNCITMGNHTWGKKDIFKFIDQPKLIRPANYPKGVVGKGYGIYECKNKKDRKIIFKDKPVRLHLQFVSRVPISDPVYIFKCKRATRNFTIHFDYDPEELKVTPIGFGFMDKAMWNENMKISKFPRSIKIRFKNWLLPGNGVVFVIEEKKN